MKSLRGFTSFWLAALIPLPFAASAQQAAPTPLPVVSKVVVNSASTDSTVLMRGPGGEVTLGQVRAAVPVLVPAPQREAFFEYPRNIEQMALLIYTRQTLAAQAKKEGFDQKPEVAQAVAISQQQMLTDLWLLHKSTENVPTENELEKYARSVFEARPAKRVGDMSAPAPDFESQRAELIEEARAKLTNQARAQVWSAAQAGAVPDADAIAAQVRPEAQK